MPANMLKTHDFSVGAGHAREIHRPIVAARTGPRTHAGAGARSPCPLVRTAHPTTTTGGPGSGNVPIFSGKPEKNPEWSFFSP